MELSQKPSHQLSWSHYVELLKIDDEMALGVKQLDALHLACAIAANCDAFLTTDKGILRRVAQIENIHITDPIGFIQETDP